MQVEPYLSFPGTCEEALRFYQGIFGGEIGDTMRFGDAPPGGMSIPPEAKDKVMHTSFKAPGLSFMASDAFQDLPPAGTTRVRLAIGSADAAEGERVFNALAEGGTIEQPYQKQFWGQYFGMCTDRFGIDWMVNAG